MGFLERKEPHITKIIALRQVRDNKKNDVFANLKESKRLNSFNLEKLKKLEKEEMIKARPNLKKLGYEDNPTFFNIKQLVELDKRIKRGKK